MWGWNDVNDLGCHVAEVSFESLANDVGLDCSRSSEYEKP